MELNPNSILLSNYLPSPHLLTNYITKLTGHLVKIELHSACRYRFFVFITAHWEKRRVKFTPKRAQFTLNKVRFTFVEWKLLSLKVNHMRSKNYSYKRVLSTLSTVFFALTRGKIYLWNKGNKFYFCIEVKNTFPKSNFLIFTLKQRKQHFTLTEE